MNNESVRVKDDEKENCKSQWKNCHSYKWLQRQKQLQTADEEKRQAKCPE